MTAERVLDAQAELGEGARWDARTSTLVWVDILRGALHGFDPSTGRDVVRRIGRHLGAVAPRRSGGFIAAAREGFVGLRDNGAEERFAAPYADEPKLRFNDGRADRAGRFWADSLSYAQEAGRAALFRLDVDGSARVMVDGLWLGNGLDWSPDDRTLYLVDTLHHRVDAFDFELASGTVSHRRRFLDVPAELGFPDGLTVDAEGGVWIALFNGGRLHRYTPAGRLDAFVEVPGARQITSCGFGSAALDVLFITTARENFSPRDATEQPQAGSLFAVRPGVRGQPTAEYLG